MSARFLSSYCTVSFVAAVSIKESVTRRRGAMKNVRPFGLALSLVPEIVLGVVFEFEYGVSRRTATLC